MKRKYQDWINNINNNVTGLCADITQDMITKFPELKRIRGHYYCVIWGQREHWWCVDSDNSIVDPTASQFPGKGSGEYVEWDESQPEPTGKCRECGEYCYDDNNFCNTAHEVSYMAYINNL